MGLSNPEKARLRKNAKGRGARVLMQVRCAQQQIGREKNPKHYSDYSIHGEECGVQFTQIVFGDQAVLVG